MKYPVNINGHVFNKGFTVIEGKCPICNKTFYGWVLKEPCTHLCPNCKVVIEIEIQSDRKSAEKGKSSDYEDLNQW